MESPGDTQNSSDKAYASKRRAEIRRRKLLMNSENRMNRIMGFSGGSKDDGDGESHAFLTVLVLGGDRLVCEVWRTKTVS